VALRAVAFDVDGTLYPNGSMYLQSLGLALTNLPLLKALEKSRNFLRDHPDTSDHFHRVQAQLVAHELDITPDRAYALIEARIYTRWFRIFRTLRLFPELRETVEAFRSTGLKLAILSDFPIRNRVTDLGLPGPWDAQFTSEDTGYLKPHPQAFLLLAQKLGLPPEDILYVGNSYTYDVLGSTGAGMVAAHLTKRPRPDSAAACSFRHYRQLREFVFRSIGHPEYNAPTGRVSS
jgi:putative hydrolase of the HAD superfamily